MTGNLYLDWAILSVSLANVILLGWLGVTVLLNAEQRTGGVWLAGGGLLLGAAFFVSHTAILGLSTESAGYGLNLWWRTGWLPLVALPLGWYVMVLWHVGFWEGSDQIRPVTMHQQRHRKLPGWLVRVRLWLVAALPYAANRQQRGAESVAGQTLGRRHWYGLVMAVALLALLAGLLLFSGALPLFNQATQLEFATWPAPGGLPLLLVLFPLYVFLCIVLSLDALRHPAPSARLMGDLARRRARPWLVAANSVLLVVCLLVSALIGWILYTAQPYLPAGRLVVLSATIGWFDLVIDLLILGAVVLVGQAIIAYEVFTGKTLPRSELRRYWLNTIILAGGLGVVVGLTLAQPLRPIYSLLLVTLLMTLFYALLAWRSYLRREEYVRQLRPFLGSQRLYEQLLHIPLESAEVASSGQAPAEVDVATLFRILCADVLGAKRAFLVAVGPLAPLVGPPLAYPDQAIHSPALLPGLLAHLLTPQSVGLPLDPRQHDGLLWATPLWSERGLIGLFLLGPRENDGLYTQEAIEIARASGERLIDIRASAELARSLVALQRQRLVETQLLDRQTRRVLHDEILPQVHAALLTLSDSDGANAQVGALLTAVHRQLADLLREMPARGAPPVVAQGLLTALRQLLADELKGAFDEVCWQVDAMAAASVAALPPLTVEVLFYAAREAMRNAARYGRGAQTERPLHLRIALWQAEGLTLQIEDNGVGVDTLCGSQPGSQQGLTLHGTMLAVVGGTLSLQSTPHAGTRVTLQLR